MPLCDFFGITYKWQITVIKSDPILKNEWKKTSSEMQFGDNRSRVCLTKKGFIRWVQLLNVNLVREELRERFIQYQAFIFDFMYGGLDRKEEASNSYARLKKLKRLYGKIGAEIQQCEKEVKKYFEDHFQLSLFDGPQKAIDG